MGDRSTGGVAARVAGSRLPVRGVTLALALTTLGWVITVAPGSAGPPRRDVRRDTTVNPENGVVTIASHHSVDETVKLLESLLRAKGVKVFALVDHSGEAKAVGLDMRPTKLLIFGNPKAGTPLMVASPSIALDLPLKVLVWEDADAKVWISYNAATYLQRRHNVPQDLVPTLAVVEAVAAKAAQ